METYDNFEFYNPNPMYRETPKSRNKPWHRGDCTVRAICAALDMRWQDAYTKSFIYASEIFDMPDSKIGFEHVLNKFGFIKVSFGKVMKGQKRPKLHDFADEHSSDICIADCGNGYYVCCRNGNYYDTKDSGFMTVYSYYIKKY